MIEKIIAGHIAGGGKRIIIPGMGAFIVRENGETVFMEMLKTDDGILTSLVSAATGNTPEEAIAAIEKFAATIQSDLSQGKEITIESIGALYKDHSGKIQLKAIATGSTKQPHPIIPEKTTYTKPQAEVSEVTDRPSIPGTVYPGEVTEERAASSPRTTDTDQGQAKPSITIQRRHKKKRVDMVLVIAAIAMALALGLMAYGYLVKKNYSPLPLETDADGIVLVEP